ncbi:major facilitator superfamily domain-containing protein [Dioszegia hungarica]|uniref:Major facilitator superfamily domain-containing protein n=1 Tax=Dioszegia hungarica TaxID=4972 RepID=A0AA38HC49_9TREE|nr:major facilitator superfamily domain-containing protein [Dioszegia hungarica]KAI9637765.1 major facilitator superfamily domain-containing protein [Dioszegia hungarica]
MDAQPVGLIEKGVAEHVDEGKFPIGEEGEGAREWEPKFMKRTQLKLDLLLLPLLTLIYMCSSLDKSNLGNAKTLGMIDDLGGDPSGETYALLNAFYFISYAPFMVPFALLAKRTRMAKVLALCACGWGIAATSFAGVQNFPGAFACRFLIGFGEAGYAPMVQVYLSRFYTRRALGVRVAFWLAMAPMGGFLNGIIAYGVSFIKSHLESWRVLFLIEGGLTLIVGIVAVVMLPEDIPSNRWLTEEERDYLMYMRAMDYAPEGREINWKHARGAFYRWQQLLPTLQNISQQITGAALSAFLPTFTSENGFKGATAQIATLAPYGSAAVCMVIASYISDHYRNRGWPSQVGWWMMILAFGIYLGVDTSNHAARFAALILAEVGHYVCTPLIVTWQANNAGNESRRAVAVPFAVACAQAVAAGSGYLFPAKDSPKYTMGSAVCLSLSAAGSIFTGIYQVLLRRENNRRDADEGGPPAEGFRPDTATYADDAPGFRYLE